MHDSSALRCEAAKARLVVIASAAKQSILSFFGALWIASLRSQ